MKNQKNSNNYTRINCKNKCKIKHNRKLLINGADYIRGGPKYFTGLSENSYYYGSIILMVVLFFFYLRELFI